MEQEIKITDSKFNGYVDLDPFDREDELTTMDSEGLVHRYSNCGWNPTSIGNIHSAERYVGTGDVSYCEECFPNAEPSEESGLHGIHG